MVRAWSAMRARDGLANPPDGVGGKLVAAAILEFLDALHQADVAFLDQIQERLAAVGVFFGDGNDEAQIGLGHVRLGLEPAVGGGFQVGERLEKLLARHAHELFQGLDFGALGLHGRAAFGGGAHALPVPEDAAGWPGIFHGRCRPPRSFPRPPSACSKTSGTFPAAWRPFSSIRAAAFPCGPFAGPSASAKYFASTFWSSARTFLMSLRRSRRWPSRLAIFLVHNHAVKAFLGRLGQQFFRDGDVFLGGETEAVNDALHLDFGFLDSSCKSRPPVRA